MNNSSRPGPGRAGLIVVAVALLGFAAMLLARCGSAPPKGPDYEAIISDWNRLAGEWSYTYELKGDLTASPQSTVEALNHWLRPYGQDFDGPFGAEIAALAEELPGSAFQEYADFRRSRRPARPPKLTLEMDNRALARALNRLANIDSDRLAPETVREIIYHNDFCAFFLGERARIQDRGWHPGAGTCRDAVPGGGRYPALNALIKPDSPFFKR